MISARVKFIWIVYVGNVICKYRKQTIKIQLRYIKIYKGLSLQWIKWRFYKNQGYVQMSQERERKTTGICQ